MTTGCILIKAPAGTQADGDTTPFKHATESLNAFPGGTPKVLLLNGVVGDQVDMALKPSDPVGQLLDEGVNVCEGFAVFTEIADERGNRIQSRLLESTSGECVVSAVSEIVHYVDLDFPILLGRSGAPSG